MSQERAKPEKKRMTVGESAKTIDQELTDDAIQIIETARQIDPKIFEGISHSKRENLIRGLALSISI